MTFATIIALALAATGAAPAEPVQVTPANFPRAETDRYIANVVTRGGFGRFSHHRDLVPQEKQTVVRPNRDTLYSTAVFDLDAGPVTVGLPDAGSRFFSLTLINEDHYIPFVRYGAGSYRITRTDAGTRYAIVGLRILVDPTRAGDIEEGRRLQDAVTVEQPGGPGRFDAPNWDSVSQAKVKSALHALGETLPNLDRAFGKQADVDPVEHLIGAAIAWGGLPRADATYLNVTPPRNDGTTVYRLRVGAVPVDAFWSITVYDDKGQLIANPQKSYALNNLSVRYAADKSATVQFGGCTASIPNCLPVTAGWNYMVRLYRPRAEILDGRWTFPAATRVSE